MKTTLNRIKANNPCTDGYGKLLKFLGKTKADNDPLELSTILKSNGLDEAIWCFCAVPGYEKEKRMFAIFCARQVQHLLTDPISINAINISERYANGQATDEELKAARVAAYDTARDIAYAAANASDAAAADAANAAYSSAYAAAYTSAYYAAAYARAADSKVVALGIVPCIINTS